MWARMRESTQCSDIIAGARKEGLTGERADYISQTQFLLSRDGVAAIPQAEIVIWAPGGAELRNLLSNFLSGSCNASFSPSILHLLFPLASHLGGLPVECIKDLWQCPVLSPSWEPIFKRLVTTQVPVRLIAPCSRAPAVAWKQLGLVTLTLSEMLPMSSWTLGPPIWTWEGDLGFYVDFPAKEIGKVRRSLGRGLGSLNFVVSPPERSPGHTKTVPRVRFHVSVKKDDVSKHELVCLFGRIKDGADCDSLMIASDELYRDPRALVMDLSDSEGIKEALPLCSHAAWVNPLRVVCLTDYLPERWEIMVSEQFIEHPEALIISVKGKESAGGKVWATCPTTAAHARATARVARADPSIPEHICNIMIHGAHSFDTVRVMREMMKRIGSLNLVEEEADGNLVPGKWAFRKEGAFGDVQGNIELMVDSQSQADIVKQELGKRHFKMGLSSFTIEVAEDRDLADETKKRGKSGSLQGKGRLGEDRGLGTTSLTSPEGPLLKCSGLWARRARRYA